MVCVCIWCFSITHAADVCSPPCENGGICTEDGCECPRGCINGQCTIPIVGQRGVCVCDPGWTGEDCNESKTRIWLSNKYHCLLVFPMQVTIHKPDRLDKLESSSIITTT